MWVMRGRTSKGKREKKRGREREEKKKRRAVHTLK
jgi:hypothetical protein